MSIGEHVIASCLDEIALEGLEGITLNSLWVRLLTRLGFRSKVDNSLRQFLWSAIWRSAELEYYLLQEERPPLTVDNVAEDQFPVNVIYDAEGIFGSCCAFDSRKNVTSHIRSKDAYGKLQKVSKEFGDRLVIVASQRMRSKAIVGDAVDPVWFTKTDSPFFRMQYCILERVARSRHSGSMTVGKSSLHSQFEARAKDIAYVVKRYVKKNILCRTACEFLSIEEPSSHTGAFVLLNRFRPSNGEETPEMRQIVEHLKICTAKRASKLQLLQLLNIERWVLDQAIARLRLLNRVAVYLELEYSKSGLPKKLRKPRHSIEIVCLTEGKQRPSEETKETVEEEEEEEEQDDEREETEVEEEEDEGAVSDDENQDWSRYDHLRSVPRQVISVLKEVGNEGMTTRELSRRIQVYAKDLAKVITSLEAEGILKRLTFTSGRIRTRRYYISSAAPESADLFDQLYKMTNVNFATLHIKNFQLTDRACKRLMAVLNFIKERRVVTEVDVIRYVRGHERKEGYAFLIDKRNVRVLLGALADQKLVNRFHTTTVKAPRVTMTFFCSNDVTAKDGLLLGKVRNAQMKIGVWSKRFSKRVGGYPISPLPKSLSSKSSYQGKFVRLQVLHEFLFYLVRAYAGDQSKQLALEHGIPEAREAVPAVFVDEISWRRFVTPLPPRTDIPPGWFNIEDIALMLPLSLFSIIAMPIEQADQLSEYSSDPVKRHYPLYALPEEYRQTFGNYYTFRYQLFSLCWKLCYLGLLSYCGRDSVNRSHDHCYYVHEGSVLKDTSSSGTGYMTVTEPVSQYKTYEYRFGTLHEVRMYWLHFRAIACSTWLGYERKSRPAGLRTLKEHKLVAALPSCAFNEVQPMGRPLGPQIGTAGLNPYMFSHKHNYWSINRKKDPYALQLYEELMQFAVEHDREICAKVTRLNVNWQSSGYMLNGDFKEVNQLRVSARKDAEQQALWRFWAKKKASRARCPDRRVVRKPLKPRDANRSGQKMRQTGVRRRRRFHVRMTYSHAELGMLILMKAVSETLSDYNRGWSELSTLVELMRTYLPAYLTRHGSKITNRMYKLSANASFYSSVTAVCRQLNLMPEIMEIKMSYGDAAVLTETFRSEAYVRAFKIALEMYKRTDDTVTLDQLDKSALLSQERVPESAEALTEDRIRLWVLSNVVMHFLMVDKHNASYGQVYQIYRQFSPDLVSRVAEYLRRQNLIMPVRKRSWPSAVTAAGARSPVFGDHLPSRYEVALTGQFRKVTDLKLFPGIAQSALELHRVVADGLADWMDLVRNNAGYTYEVADHMFDGSVTFDVVVPKDLVDSGCLAAKPGRTVASGQQVSFLSASTESEEDEEEEGEVDGDGPAPQWPSKKQLFTLRSQHLGRGQELAAALRVNHLTLNPCQVHAKRRATVEAGGGPLVHIGACELAERHLAKTYDMDVVEQAPCEEDSNVLKALMSTVIAGGCAGVRVADLDTVPDMRRAAELAVRRGRIFRVGIDEGRYVHRNCIHPWVVVTAPRVDQLSEVAAKRKKVEEETTDSVTTRKVMMPRPWLLPDGHVDMPLIRWLCEGMFMRIVLSPGITEDSLKESFSFFLSPPLVEEVLWFLVEARCIRRETVVRQWKRFTLFGYTLEPPEECVYYRTELEAMARFGALFESTDPPKRLVAV